MKLGVAILAVIALIAFNHICAAEEASQGTVIKVIDQVGPLAPPWSDRSRRAPAHRRSNDGYPVACGAVLFPRSPLCAGRPANLGAYPPAHLPWQYWYY
jgi:hypothetical protein